MGKKLIAMCVMTMALLTASGCMVAPVMPPMGSVYNNTQAPLDIDMQNTKIGSKQGEASTYSILSLMAFGDGGIDAAAKNGGIKTVQHVEYRYVNVLFLFQSYTTIVYGE